MASTVSGHSDALMERLVDRISAKLDEVERDIRAYLARRATETELRRLSPRELNDIGVGAGEIEEIARRSYN